MKKRLLGFGSLLLIAATEMFSLFPFEAAGRGAVVPWIEYQAEDGSLSAGARIVGPSRTYGTQAGEASGRKAVMLEQAGASVAWKVSSPANSIVIRFCIPDAPAGGGIEAPIALFINGQKKTDMILTSVHSWVYGKDNDNQTDDPTNGQARKLYDEVRLLFNGYNLVAGDSVMLKKEAAASNASYECIDFIDLEQVGAPIPMPVGYIAVTDSNQTWKGASQSDSTSFDHAFYMCLTEAQAGKYAGVYIPPGTWLQKQKQQPKNVKIQGAGMWYTTLYCPDKSAGDWGTTGFIISGDNCEFRDFAMTGWGGTRTQGGKAFCSNAYKNMVAERLWIEHVCCADWVGGGGESTNLHFKDCRIRNTGADGINLCNGSLNCLIENCHARNTGDDAFAIWSATDGYSAPCTGNIIRNCTAELPWRANCFGVYGGRGNRIENCLGVDAITYPGLTISTDFSPWPLDSVTVDSITLTRCGGHYFVGYPYENDFGAIWLLGVMTPNNGIKVKNADIIDPTYSGILIQGAGTFNSVLFDNVTIANPTTNGVEIRSEVNGDGTLRNVKLVSNLYTKPRLTNLATKFKLTDETGVAGKQELKTSATRVQCRGGSRPVVMLNLPAKAENETYRVKVTMHLLNGKIVNEVVDKIFSAGSYSINMDRVRTKSAGVYLAEVTIDGKREVFRIMVE